jgi:hypothetical protein
LLRFDDKKMFFRYRSGRFAIPDHRLRPHSERGWGRHAITKVIQASSGNEGRQR